ncbi:MAG: hypothetical protein JWR09_326 [Mucilaginibacter sp.]|nr:hypothetical protein [Mucilaginibacter sp.]
MLINQQTYYPDVNKLNILFIIAFNADHTFVSEN